MGSHVNLIDNENLNKIFPVFDIDMNTEKNLKMTFEELDPLEKITPPIKRSDPIPIPVKPLDINDLPCALDIFSSAFFSHLEKEINELNEKYSDKKSIFTKPKSALDEVSAEAHAGNLYAMFELASLYHHGTLVDKNYSEAKRWYQAALQKGHIGALTELGKLYLEKNDIGPAKNMFIAAAHHNDQEAFYHLGKLYSQSKEYDKAFEYTLKAAAGQNAKAINHLGLLQMKGLGTTKDYKAALVNFDKARKKNDLNAMNNYAFMHHKGLGIKVDLEKARIWYEQAAGRGNAAAYYHLGRIYEKGEGVEAHKETAEDCYLAAAKLGSIKSMYRIGCWYRDLRETKPGIKWLKKASERNHPEAAFHLWELLKTDDFDKGYQYLNQATKLGYPVKKKAFEQKDSCLY